MDMTQSLRDYFGSLNRQKQDTEFMPEDARIVEERLATGEGVQVGSADADPLNAHQGLQLPIARQVARTSDQNHPVRRLRL